MDLTTLAALAAIGAFIANVISVILELQKRAKEQPFDPERRRKNLRILLTINGVLILVLLGVAVYWMAIIIATSSPGTSTDIVSRSTIWATIFGTVVGITWSLSYLPFLKRLYTGNQKAKE